RPQIEQELLEHFGPKVLHIVLGCTDTQNDSGAKDSPGSPKESWAERKTAYLKHLEQLDPTDPLSASVLLVSNADKLHNARSILRDWQQVGEAVWERFKGGKEGSLWYYQRLAEIFGRRPSPLSEELQRVVRTLEDPRKDCSVC
ncbi:MAG: HD domain-containing protein, partial [Thermostichus sp. BF3_bins_97]